MEHRADEQVVQLAEEVLALILHSLLNCVVETVVAEVEAELGLGIRLGKSDRPEYNAKNGQSDAVGAAGGERARCSVQSGEAAPLDVELLERSSDIFR